METKPFNKTSEFWASVAASVGIWASHAAESGQLPLKYTGLLQTLLAVGYGISRGLAKLGVAAKPE